MNASCSVTECARPIKARGMCGAHLERSRRGSPMGSPVRRVGQPFESYYDVTVAGCWEWNGSISPEGYGRMNKEYAHRISYTIAHGSIPSGLQIDHLCRNRRCVNPQHLEAVSQRENILRGNAPSAVARRRSQCSRGHEFDAANTHIDRRGRRICRACRRVAAA